MLGDFPKIAAKLSGRPQRFIVFVDDLSFDEGEHEYKELKAILEGSLAARPENVLIYATSNRRHLIKETFHDRDGEVHRQDTVQEKLSLADRFGITVTYLAPDKDAYLSIVEGLARRHGPSHRHAHPPSAGLGMGGLAQRPIGTDGATVHRPFDRRARFESLELLGGAKTRFVLLRGVQDHTADFEIARLVVLDHLEDEPQALFEGKAGHTTAQGRNSNAFAA